MKKCYIEYTMTTYPTLYEHPADVLEHMFCANGNGVEWWFFDDITDDIKEMAEYCGCPDGFTFKNDFENMEPVSLKHIYPWSDTERFQPFRKYLERKEQPAINAAAQYFIKCVELTTEQSMTERMIGDKSEFMARRLLEELEKYHLPALRDWKKNIGIMKNLFTTDKS